MLAPHTNIYTAPKDKFDVKFGLSPQILQTCSQIYAEGMWVLYNDNTFFVDCSQARFKSSIQSPVLRHTVHYNKGYIGSTSEVHSVQDHKAFFRVQNWRVLLNAEDEERYGPSRSRCLALFCNSISELPSLSLTFGLIPGLVGSTLGKNWALEFRDVKDLLKPVRTLRNVRQLEIVPEKHHMEISGYEEFRNLEAREHIIPPELVEELKYLVKRTDL